jgi:hypothetical protein
MAITWEEFVLKLSTAFFLCENAFTCSAAVQICCTVFLQYSQIDACAEIVSLQLQTQPVQAAETLLTVLPSSHAFSPNYIRKLAGRGSLSVEPMALDKNRYLN